MTPELDLDPEVLAALSPRFTLQRRIGAGGMSTVFLAHDERNERPVAIKILREGPHTGSDVERFEREIKLLARLQHPLILPLHDSGIAGDAMYFVMPYVEGDSLRTRLTFEGALPLEEAVRIATEVADALSYAHAQGIVHRDIKPENIMLWRGHAVVCDFGIASITQGAPGATPERLTQGGQWLGTPGFMSPEQALGEPDLGPASDQYSLGLVLYEMLAGVPAYDGTPRAVLARQLTEPPPAIAALRPGFPSPLVDAIGRALAKTPELRWPSTVRFAEALRGVAGGSVAPAPESVDARPSLAILPFTNLAADGSNDYFSDGLTEELIGSISRLPRLRVVSRTSAFVFRDTTVALTEIGARLRVGYVLTGSVRRAGERLRLSAQLSRVADDTLLWSETYERTMADVFEVQDDLARRITATVREALGTGEAKTPAPAPHPQSVMAYDHYLLGRYLWNKRTSTSLREGMACFQRAIDADARFAAAHAGLADSYALLASNGAMLPHEAYPPARVAALRALELDDALAEAHASLGLIKLNYDWDWEGSERAFQAALNLNPSYSTARQWYSSYLSSMARHDEAIASAQQAAALDPFSITATIRVGIAYAHAARWAESAATLERAMAMDPSFLHSHSWLTMAYLRLGRPDDALRVAEDAYAASRNAPGMRPLIAFAWIAMGRDEEARPIIMDRLHAPETNPFGRALLHLVIGERDQCFTWLARGVEERGDQMHSLRTNPYFDAARDDPRFRRILERMRL